MKRPAYRIFTARAQGASMGDLESEAASQAITFLRGEPGRWEIIPGYEAEDVSQPGSPIWYQAKIKVKVFTGPQAGRKFMAVVRGDTTGDLEARAAEMARMHLGGDCELEIEQTYRVAPRSASGGEELAAVITVREMLTGPRT